MRALRSGLLCVGLLAFASSASAQPLREIEPVPNVAQRRVLRVVCDTRSVYAYVSRQGVPTVHRWDGERWRALPLPADFQLLDITALPDGQLYVTAGRRVLRWSGTAWYAYPVEEGPRTRGITALFAFGPTRVIGVGSGRVYLRDGLSMRPYDAGTWRELEDVWASSVNDVWAVGEGGTVMRWNGTAWRRAGPSTDAWLRGVTGSGPANVWVWGTRAHERAIYHWDGERWNEPELPPLYGQRIHTDGTETYAVGAGVARLADDGTWEELFRADDVRELSHLTPHLCRTEHHWFVVDETGLAFTWDRSARR